MGISCDTWSGNPWLPLAHGPESLFLPKPGLLLHRPAKLPTLRGGNQNNLTDDETEARGAILFKPGNARALNSNTMESKVPRFNLCHCEHGVPSKPRLGKTRVWASAREVTWGRTGLAHLQQLQVCRLCLGGHQLCQHLRHHPHVPTHHLELTVQLRDLKHTVGPGE